MFCSHLLRFTCRHSRGIQGEVKKCNWITEGMQQCGKRKWEEIRSLDGQGERVKRDKRRQRDRKSEGDPTPKSQRRDQQLDPAAELELCHSCQRLTVPLETLNCLLSPSMALLSPHSHPFIETWEQCREVCLTCSRQSGPTDCTNEISCPLRKPYKPIFLPCQMWAGNPSSRLSSLTLRVATSQPVLTLHSHPEGL